MDEFVCNILTEWGLSQYIDQFKDEEIDEESLFCLEDEAIDKLFTKEGPKAKFKKNLKLLKESTNKPYQEIVDPAAQYQQQHEEAAVFAQVLPSTSNTNDKEEVLSDARLIMKCVSEKMSNQDNNKLKAFLKNKISDLETDKREIVGAFGKTGAGKSSLINAVLGEKNLLPSGGISACTAVMIKVEANMRNSNFEADIEFITEEDWRQELNTFLGEKDRDDDDYHVFTEKLSTLYGEGWEKLSSENLIEKLMDGKHFREIPEFLESKRKKLICKSGRELSEKSIRYIRRAYRDRQSGEVKKSYWPLVKCVTVRVPNKDLLQHVTLVDLPGNGDRNKSRDEMWKEVVGRCSTVWIVTEINRAGAEKEPWEILENASSLMGNGGECQEIHFICTKSDLIGDLDDDSAANVRAHISERNTDAKEAVKKEFSKQTVLKKHFDDDCLKVFTVSSKEFLKKKYLNPEETEIPKLREFLQKLNDRHSVTLNYVSGAHGILSLIQGTHHRDVADQKREVCTNLEEKMKQELDKVRKPIEEAYEAFEKHLTDGVEKSKSSCEGDLRSILHPAKSNGSGFHKTLRCIVEKSGVHKTHKGKQINLNMKLASHLTDSIDEDFRRTFPNDRKCGPFNGVINTFSLGTERLIETYKDVELQLIFLKSEEEIIKTKLNKYIREQKKIIYNSLTRTIQETMKECYDEAAKFTGLGTMENMRETIQRHVRASKNTMFDQAKRHMLWRLRDLKEYILKTLEETMQESIKLSLKTDDYSLPDVSEDLAKMKQ